MEAAGEGKECREMFWLFLIGALVLEVCLRRLVPQMGTRWKVVGVTVLFAVVLFYRGNLLLPASEVKEVIGNPGNENAASANAADITVCIATTHHLLVLMISTKGLQRGFITHGR